MTEGVEPQESPDGADELGVRRLIHERLTGERERIRAARAYFARQLGPLPAAAGISVAIVGAFSDKITNRTWLYIALGGFGVMIVLSVAYSRMPAYRELRSQRLETDADRQHQVSEAPKSGDQASTPLEWYRAENKLEHDIYAGSGTTRRLWWLPRKDRAAGLEEQLDKERFGVFAVQGIFLVVIASLFLARFG